MGSEMCIRDSIHGAMRAVPQGQLEAARAYGMSATQVLWRVHIRQMWVYAPVSYTHLTLPTKRIV